MHTLRLWLTFHSSRWDGRDELEVLWPRPDLCLDLHLKATHSLPKYKNTNSQIHLHPTSAHPPKHTKPTQVYLWLSDGLVLGADECDWHKGASRRKNSQTPPQSHQMKPKQTERGNMMNGTDTGTASLMEKPVATRLPPPTKQKPQEREVIHKSYRWKGNE